MLSQQFALTLISTHAGDRQGWPGVPPRGSSPSSPASCQTLYASRAEWQDGSALQPRLLSILSLLPLADQALATALGFCFEVFSVLTRIRSSLKLMTAGNPITRNALGPPPKLASKVGVCLQQENKGLISWVSRLFLSRWTAAISVLS